MNRRASTPSPNGRIRMAFTLVELLIVVAIMATLFAVLIPGLRSAREQAARVKCMTNLRALAQAWLYYLDENDGKYPAPLTNDDVNYGGRQGTSSRKFGADERFPVEKFLNPSLKLPAVTTDPVLVYRCPRDRGSDLVSPSYYIGVGTSYRANPFLLGRKPNCNAFREGSDNTCRDICNELKDQIRYLTRGNIRSPAKVLLFGDFPWFDTWTWQPSDPPTREWHALKRHFNFSYLDTHTEFVRIDPREWTTSRYTVSPIMESAEASASSCGVNQP